MADDTTQITSRKIVNSINAVDADEWNSISKENNVYLTLEYLLAIEESMKDEMDFYYAISYDQNNRPVLAAAFQIATYVDKRRITGNKFSCVISRLKSRLFTFNIIVCGNVFSDGENGFLYHENMSKSDAISELETLALEVLGLIKNSDRKASIVLFKEFWSKENNYGTLFKQTKFREFMIDVNMVLFIHKDWTTMENYLFSLKKKYRSRAKTVYRKSGELELKELSATEIEKYSERIQELFDNVAEKTEFSFGKINTDAFVKLKSALHGMFLFRAAFLDGEMVGFSTAFCNNDVLEANYVGIDYKHNSEKDIYQRLLYDFIEQSIARGSKELHLGRTSELIKSAIGAVPENMNLYAKHGNRIHNMLLKPIFHFIAPSEFELRQPFKTEYTN